jgi:uncharacterized protein YodC (DUF2158 family)
MDFKLGDIVSLRSGSPPMTVYDTAENSVTVVFYNPVTGLIVKETLWYQTLRSGATIPTSPPRA